jgi:hypothetical protein
MFGIYPTTVPLRTTTSFSNNYTIAHLIRLYSPFDYTIAHLTRLVVTLQLYHCALDTFGIYPTTVPLRTTTSLPNNYTIAHDYIITQQLYHCALDTSAPTSVLTFLCAATQTIGAEQQLCTTLQLSLFTLLRAPFLCQTAALKWLWKSIRARCCKYQYTFYVCTYYTAGGGGIQTSQNKQKRVTTLQSSPLPCPCTHPSILQTALDLRQVVKPQKYTTL